MRIVNFSVLFICAALFLQGQPAASSTVSWTSFGKTEGSGAPNDPVKLGVVLTFRLQDPAIVYDDAHVFFINLDGNVIGIGTTLPGWDGARQADGGIRFAGPALTGATNPMGSLVFSLVGRDGPGPDSAGGIPIGTKFFSYLTLGNTEIDGTRESFRVTKRASVVVPQVSVPASLILLISGVACLLGSRRSGRRGRSEIRQV